ncbi:MAG: CPBP family intramembrane glutamic endopeptidase [Methanobacterium sp.]
MRFTEPQLLKIIGGIVISKFPFLFNAESGKNNWWRYLITIVATWGVQAVVGFIIGLIVIVMLIMRNGISRDVNSITNIFQDPFFLLPLTLVGFVASFIALYLCMRFIHNRKFISLITIKSKINWMRVLKGASLWLAILGIFTIISILLDPNGYQFTFNPSTFGILLIISLITFPIQASFEELFFRGYLMQGFGLLSKKPIIPLLATSIIFGLVHAGNGTNMTLSGLPVIEAAIIGLMLGIITLGENSIETATGIHIMNNLYVALIVSTQGSVLGNVPSVLTAPSEPNSGIIWTVIFALIAITVIFWGKKDRLMDIFSLKDAENEDI